MPNITLPTTLLGRLRTLEQIISHQPAWLDKNRLDSAGYLATLQQHQAALHEKMQALTLEIEQAQKQAELISKAMLGLPEGTSSPLVRALCAGELDATFLDLFGAAGHYSGSGSGSGGPTLQVTKKKRPKPRPHTPKK
jgi:hypothetical protein